ncbi:hypothetical protein [Profundibacter sp.]
MKRTALAFLLTIAGFSPIDAQTARNADTPLACSHFTPDARYINITLVMQLEKREVAMRVPQEFLEDAWNRQEGARKTAFLFRTMIDTFEPVTRAQTPKLNFEYTSFLINDYIDLPKLAELMLDLASPGNASPWEPLSAYNTRPFQYGLVEVIPNYPKELQENVYLQMGPNGAVKTVIACSVTGTVAFPGCQQFSRTPSGVDIKFSYPIRFLPIWQDMQNNIHSFVECAIDEARKTAP